MPSITLIAIGPLHILQTYLLLRGWDNVPLSRSNLFKDECEKKVIKQLKTTEQKARMLAPAFELEV